MWVERRHRSDVSSETSVAENSRNTRADRDMAREFLGKLENERRRTALERRLALERPVTALAGALRARCPETAGHVARIAAWSRRIARAIGLSDSEIADVRLGAYLHDVGKVGLPDAVLLKHGVLSEEEMELMKSHPLIGAHLVSSVGLGASVSEIVRHHHERFDGSGYPDGLLGDAVPLGARIVAVVDAFDAMSTSRVYRDRLEPSTVIRRLLRGRGEQFDPGVVEVFLRTLDDGGLDGSGDDRGGRRPA